MYVVKRGKKYRFTETYRDPLTNKRRLVSVSLDRNTLQSKNRARMILQAKIAKIMSQVNHMRVSIILCTFENPSLYEMLT